MTRFPSSRRSLWILALAAAGILAPRTGIAQAGNMCPRGRIREVQIQAGSILDPDEIRGRPFEWGWRLVNALHFPTREAFIRSDLLFHEGTCYDPTLLAESERTLRGYRFIASASVEGIRGEDGDWTVKVTTRDEWSTRLNLDVSLDGRLLFQGGSASEINLLGRGITSTLFYTRVDQLRNRGLLLHFPRVLSTRMDGTLSLGKTRTGEFLTVESSYPFLGEVGRTATLQRLSFREGYIRFGTGTRDGVSHVLLPVEDLRGRFTLAHRWGEPGALLEVGASLAYLDLDARSSREEIRTASDDRFDELGAVSDSLYGIVQPQARRFRSTMAGVLVNRRNIRFVPRSGLELIRGTQDVAVGMEGGLSLGVGMAGMANRSSAAGDLLVGGRFFSGHLGERGVLTLRTSMAARRARIHRAGFSRWRDIGMEVEGVGYWVFSTRTHLYGRVEAQGAWRVDQPYQSTLGGVGGVRGYFEEELPVGAGMVGTLEARVDLGRPEMVDLGLVAFVDGGRGWAEGAPFGVDTGWISALGGGIRFAFPAASRALLRVEGAWPMRQGGTIGDVLFRAYFVDLQGLLGLRGTRSGYDPQLDVTLNRLRGP